MYKHSRWSIGQRLAPEIIKKSWMLTRSSVYDETEDDGENHVDDVSKAAPGYSLHRSSTTKLKDVRVIDPDLPTFQEREEESKSTRITHRNEGLEEEEMKKVKALRDKNLFPCTALKGLQRCTKVYTSSKHLDHHMSTGKHNFPSMSSLDVAMQTATSVGGVLCSGNFINTSSAVKKGLELTMIDGVDEDWCRKGVYNRPARKAPERMTAALKDDLEIIFEEGQKTNKKLSALKVVDKLTDMRNPDGTLRYSYDPNNPNGRPPDVNKVKQFFSRLSAQQKKGPVEKEVQLKIPELKGALEERGLPIRPPSEVLKAILRLCDLLKINADEDDTDNDEIDYTAWKVVDLKAEIQRRGHTIETEKKKFQLLLHLYNIYNDTEEEEE